MMYNRIHYYQNAIKITCVFTDKLLKGTYDRNCIFDATVLSHLSLLYIILPSILIISHLKIHHLKICLYSFIICPQQLR